MSVAGPGASQGRQQEGCTGLAHDVPSSCLVHLCLVHLHLVHLRCSCARRGCTQPQPLWHSPAGSLQPVPAPMSRAPGERDEEPNPCSKGYQEALPGPNPSLGLGLPLAGKWVQAPVGGSVALRQGGLAVVTSGQGVQLDPPALLNAGAPTKPVAGKATA